MNENALADMNEKALADMLADMNEKALADMLADMNEKALADMLADMNENALADMNENASADMLADMNENELADMNENELASESDMIAVGVANITHGKYVSHLAIFILMTIFAFFGGKYFGAKHENGYKEFVEMTDATGNSQLLE